MAKMAILKPIMWNNNGYQRPAGCPSTSGYSHEKGYGHEEWNNNPRWIWQGWKVFHTEGGTRLLEAAKGGDLGMVMVAMHGGTAYALGVAANVYANEEKGNAMLRIADAVGKGEDWAAVWQLQTVQKSFSSRDAFLRHWRSDYHWIRWRCFPDHFYWFPKPIPLDPMRISGKKRLSMHHGRFTETTPAVVLDIIYRRLPKGRTAIADWFSSGEFARRAEPKTKSQKSGARILRRNQHGRNAPSDRRFQYWVEGNRNVEPLHHRLQTLFLEYLKARGIAPQENVDYIDVQYTEAGTTTFCEIKPTDNVRTLYAIRAAIGQLFWYRYTGQNPTAALEIVLGTRPEPSEVDFVRSLGVGMKYYDTKAGTFVTV